MDFKKKVLEKKLEVIFFMKFWFLKFYVSGLNEIDFTGITLNPHESRVQIDFRNLWKKISQLHTSTSVSRYELTSNHVIVG